MFHLSKFQAKILLLSGLIGFVILGSFFKNQLAFDSLNAIADEVSSSESSTVEFAPLQQWFEAGSHPQDYAMGGDRSVTRNGNASATIQAKPGAIEGFGTLMQVFDASAYRGSAMSLASRLPLSPPTGGTIINSPDAFISRFKSRLARHN